MSLTLAQKLTSVQTAIVKIEEGAASTSVDGMSVTRADLGLLYAREERLERKIAAEARGATGTGRRVVEM